MIFPKQAVRFGVNVMFPEAVFVALSAPELYVWSSQYYRKRSKRQEENATFSPAHKYSNYIRDKVVIDTLSVVILGAFVEVIGDDELEKLFKIRGHKYEEIFLNYATQYVDKCNIEYLKMTPEKKRGRLSLEILQRGLCNSRMHIKT